MENDDSTENDEVSMRILLVRSLLFWAVLSWGGYSTYKKFEEQKARMDQVETSAMTCRVDLEQLKDELHDLDTEVDELKSKVEDLDSRVDDVESNVSEVEDEASDAKSKAMQALFR